ncbi:MAG: hypothetical protein FJ265_21110, partial [Planctomycetes bacterium]|nr:hypothetical protein [Planctomycetota bacterium]
MKQANLRSLALGSAAIALAALVGCDGRTTVADAGNDSRPQLVSADLGRLVDVYAYQRIDPAVADRRLRFNRQPVLVAENVVVNPNIESQILFDASGAEVLSATYEFRPFDKTVGHEELLILWDNQHADEAGRFAAALDAAQAGLPSLASAYRGQNTMLRPIPIVPRNAAIRLQFSGTLDVTEEFFRINPTAIQVLEFKGDPAVVRPTEAFRVLSARVIPQGTRIVVDTTILGGEGESGFTTPGLPSSTDSVTANIRIAIPTRGGAVSSFYLKEDSIAELNALDSLGRPAVIRDFRSGNQADGAAGRLYEAEAPMIVASLGMGITAIDTANRVVTLHKRSNFVPVRA